MQLKWPMLWDLFSLFPAYAGVILPGVMFSFGKISFPRIRGGDPQKKKVNIKVTIFSPHTRG